MNLIDNGIKEVINITKIDGAIRTYYIVEFIDFYGSEPRKKEFYNIQNIENRTWTE